MTTPSPVVHQYQAEVERLCEKAVLSGAALTHADLLRQVARNHHVRSWDSLQQPPVPAGILQALFGPKWERKPELTVTALLFDLRMHSLVLGVAPESLRGNHARIEAPAYLARRGVLVVGPDGKGATTALEHYAAQQLAKGAGLLVLDASANRYSPTLLEDVAKAAHRADYEHVTLDGYPSHTLPLFEQRIKAKAAQYVSLDWRASRDERRSVAEDLVQRMLSCFEVLAHDAKPEWPFMLMVMADGALLTEAWEPLLHHANALGILLVLRLQSLQELDRLPAEMVELVLNLHTQLYLAPSSTGAFGRALDVLAMGQDADSRAMLGQALVGLELGHAMLRNATASGAPEVVRLCLLKSERI